MSKPAKALELGPIWDRSTAYMALWDAVGDVPTPEQIAAAVATAEDVRALLSETERLRDHSIMFNRVGYQIAKALGLAPGGQSVEADPLTLVGRLVAERDQYRREASFAAEETEHQRSAPECPGRLCPECLVCPLCSGDGHSESCSRQGEETVRIPLRQCCGYHNTNCEPPYELCCAGCSEAGHPNHPAGVACVLAVSTGE